MHPLFYSRNPHQYWRPGVYFHGRTTNSLRLARRLQLAPDPKIADYEPPGSALLAHIPQSRVEDSSVPHWQQSCGSKLMNTDHCGRAPATQSPYYRFKSSGRNAANRTYCSPQTKYSRSQQQCVRYFHQQLRLRLDSEPGISDPSEPPPCSNAPFLHPGHVLVPHHPPHAARLGPLHRTSPASLDTQSLLLPLSRRTGNPFRSFLAQRLSIWRHRRRLIFHCAHVGWSCGL
ncbi:hypothetical protein B0H11DRAFT_943415 [Mycena galericulata]|nr:hypothetical protein B0H11DRAFT_943415 [Mycena galericulata]